MRSEVMAFFSCYTDTSPDDLLVKKCKQEAEKLHIIDNRHQISVYYTPRVVDVLSW